MVRREYYEKKVSHKGVAIDSYWMKGNKHITQPSREGGFTVSEEKGWVVPALLGHAYPVLHHGSGYMLSGMFLATVLSAEMLPAAEPA